MEELIARKLRELVKNEDGRNPLTDQELAKALHISRSKITTIRKNIGILNSRERRELILQQDISNILSQDKNLTVRSITENLTLLGYDIAYNSVYKFLEGFKDRSQSQAKVKTKKPAVNSADDLSTDSFAKLIGSDGSLKHQVDQAKAAVLYPPTGLHTIIIGESGVGKSKMAEAMYQFALGLKGKNSKTFPFAEFNCADYAENPQLLIAQLFGYVAGAFTGAVTSKEGLIAAADGGIFFLDEIHRLPPDGQEMLFQVIDKGVYRALGSKELRAVKVMIIAATTEDIGESLLNTFRRRIPMVIQMPSLEQREIAEKNKLIKAFFQMESTRINIGILVKSAVIKKLLTTVYLGNIGELRSQIQVACARAYLNHVVGNITNTPLIVNPDNLGFAGGEAAAIVAAQRDISWYGAHDVLFLPEGQEDLSDAVYLKDPYEFSNEIYRIIEGEYKKLHSRHISDNEINSTIWNLVEKRIGRYLNQFQAQRNLFPGDSGPIQKMVDGNIINMVKDMLVIAKEDLDINDEGLLFLLSTHLSSALDRLKNGAPILNAHLRSLIIQHPKEFLVAKKMAKCSVRDFGLELPEEEIGFLAMYLAAARNDTQEETPSIGLVVATHGKVASAMVSVVESLLGAHYIEPLDIGLDENPQQIYQRLLNTVIKSNQGKGVIILTDMGSPENFGQRITEEIGIITRTVTRVDTLMVLDAVRKVYLPNVDIDEVANSLVSQKRPLVLNGPIEHKKPELFAVFCLTGEGSGLFLEKWLRNEKRFKEFAADINCLNALQPKDIKKQIMDLEADYHVLGVLGPFNPGLAWIPNILMKDINDSEAVSHFFAKAKKLSERTDFEVKEQFQAGEAFESKKLGETLFNQKLIFVNQPSRTKTEIIDYMCGILQQEGYVDHTYRASVYDREDMGNTGLDIGIAMPHGYSQYVLKPAISLYISRETLLWDCAEVKLIIMPALTEDWGNAFSQVYEVIAKDAVMEELFACGSPEEALKIVKEYL